MRVLDEGNGGTVVPQTDLLAASGSRFGLVLVFGEIWAPYSKLPASPDRPTAAGLRRGRKLVGGEVGNQTSRQEQAIL